MNQITSNHHHQPSVNDPDKPLSRSSRHTHLIRAAIIGILSGLVAVAFKLALSGAESSRNNLLNSLHTDAPAWGWIVLPFLGLLLGSFVGFITQRFSPEAAGSGIPHLKGVLLHLRTLNPARILPVKFFGGVLGIGSGLCLGREGPTVQMGSAVASAICKFLHVHRADVPQLLSAGAGAGLAAAFNAPLAGLIFIIEELHRELSSRTALGGLVACVLAVVVAHSLTPDIPTFEVRNIHALPLSALPWACVIAVLTSAGAVLFNTGLLSSSKYAHRIKKIPRWLLPGLVCATIGLIAWKIPLMPGGGHYLADGLLSGKLSLSIAVLAGLLALKFCFTLLSYATGAPGGIFAPMLVLGVLIGTLTTRLLLTIEPSLADHASALAVLGMVGFFIGSVRTPLTGIVLISELTGGYTLLLPICAVAGISYLTAETLRSAPIYEALLEADLARKGHDEIEGRSVSIYVGVQNGSSLEGRPLRQAGLPPGCLVVAVERSGHALHPAASLALRAGDHITVLCPTDMPEAPAKIVAICTGL